MPLQTLKSIMVSLLRLGFCVKPIKLLGCSPCPGLGTHVRGGCREALTKDPAQSLGSPERAAPARAGGGGHSSPRHSHVGSRSASCPQTAPHSPACDVEQGSHGATGVFLNGSPSGSQVTTERRLSEGTGKAESLPTSQHIFLFL